MQRRSLLLAAHAEVHRRDRHAVRLRLAEGGSITPRIDAVYQSEIYFTTNNQGAQEGVHAPERPVAVGFNGQSLGVALYGQNLTDEGYFNGKLSLVGFFGREQGNPGTPRTWGLIFTRNFQ